MGSTLGERIKQIIQTKNLKQVEFAKSLGISANYVYLLTSGRKATISDPLAKLIETIYGYPAEWIKTGEIKRDPSHKTVLEADTIWRLKQMSYEELCAVAAFIQSMEALPNGME